MTLVAPQQAGAENAGGSEAAVAARGLSFLHQGGRGLNGLTLSVPRGSIFGLLGSNGSGKTTFLLMVAGLLTPAEGEIRVLGSAPGRRTAVRSGWVFQEQALDPSLTVRETLLLSARLYGWPAGGSAEAAAGVGLADRLDDRVAALSGGMRRRLELARAIQHSPELLVLDEPTLGLDLESRRSFWEQIRKLNEDGLTVLVATNDVHEAEASCHDVALLREGACVAQGSPTDLDRTRGDHSIHLRWPGISAEDADALRSLEGTTSFARAGDQIRLTALDPRAVLGRLARLQSGRIESISISESSLEDTYFQLTGTGLISSRDDER